MSFATNIGCFKSRHEMFKHKWTCDWQSCYHL